MIKRFSSILIIVLSVFVLEAFSKSWNGISPGVTTRFEVKKILGKGDPWLGEVERYQLKRSTVYITYEFRKDKNYSDKDIVTEIYLTPDNRGEQLLSSYIRKIRNFHQDFVKIEIADNISHVHGLTNYINYEEGFTIRVIRGDKTEREFIIGFQYFAPRPRPS